MSLLKINSCCCTRSIHVVLLLIIQLVSVRSVVGQNQPVSLSPKRNFQAHKSTVYVLQFSKTGSRLYSGDGGGAIHVWDTRRFKLQAQVAHPQTAVRGLAFDSTGRTMLAGGSPYLTVWNVRSDTPQPIRRLEQSGVGFSAIALSKDSKIVVTGGTAGMVTFWLADKGQVRQMVAHSKVHGRATLDIVLLKDSSSFASIGTNSALKIWDAKTGALKSTPIASRQQGRDDAVKQAVFSQDGSFVVITTADGFAIHDVQTGKERQKVKTAGDSLRRLALSADDRLLAASHNGSDSGFSLYNIKDGKLLANVKKTGSIDALAFSPRGTILATGSKHQIMIWDVVKFKAGS